jgi:hypothetical protein
MTSEHIWVWLQTKGKVFKVISDPEKGIIEVINEKGEILIRKTNLSKRQVETVEKNFLFQIAKRSNDRGQTQTGEKRDAFDPMISNKTIVLLFFIISNLVERIVLLQENKKLISIKYVSYVDTDAKKDYDCG